MRDNKKMPAEYAEYKKKNRIKLAGISNKNSFFRVIPRILREIILKPN